MKRKIKKRLSYTVDMDLKEDFDKYVEAKYGTRSGMRGTELEKAIKLYLAVNDNKKYIQDPSIKLFLRVLKRRIKKIKERHPHSDLELFTVIFKKEYENTRIVTSRELAYFTGFVEGITDPKNIQNKINYLISKGLLRPIGPNTFEIENIHRKYW